MAVAFGPQRTAKSFAEKKMEFGGTKSAFEGNPLPDLCIGIFGSFEIPGQDD